jgi:glycosyltransferase involved in cell wall biosynthesis
MNIFFLSYYSGKVYRGVETFVHHLANHLSQSGNDIYVFQSGPKIADSRYTVITLDTAKKEFPQSALNRIGRQPGIIFSTGGRKESLACKFHTSVHGQKLVISGQSGLGLDDRINLLTFPDAFIALTKHQAKWAKKVNPLVKIFTIPNGVDINIFHPRSTGIKFSLPPPVVLYTAALVASKRQALAISAVKNTSASLLLVGSGPDRDKLEREGQELLPGRFEIAAFPHDQMPLVYPSAHLFIYPTVAWESFGIAILEAMACGLPVVATDDPIRKEIVGPAGLFADPGNSPAFSRAINQALNKDWDHLPQTRAGEFSWEKVTAAYLQVFNHL